MLSKKERIKRNKIRRKLVEDGILPKPQPKRNYRTYFSQVEEMRKENDPGFFGLAQTLMMFYPSHEKKKGDRFSDMEKAAIRMMHFAIEKGKFIERLTSEGKSEYTVEEFYNEVYVKVFPEREYANRERGKEVENDN